MKFMYFSIKYRYSDILLKKNIKFRYSRMFCCSHTCYCVGMVSVMPASCYVMSASHYISMYILGLIPWNWLVQFRLRDRVEYLNFVAIGVIIVMGQHSHLTYLNKEDFAFSSSI